eukprot:scaffold16855_cov99-Skeletonema_dohrnii-CCMP3373.AAC.1
MAELREELLFKQPESSHLGDCPICFLPLSLDVNKSSLSSCCCVLICNGCSHANHIKDKTSMRDPRCPFCRVPYVSSAAEAERNIMKRIKAGDRVAFRQKGCQAREERNYSVAVEFLTKAANMGDVEAHNQFGELYHNGQGVERDMKKAVHHWEEAAIGGHPGARFVLGANDAFYGGKKFNRAVKHFIIAASQGNDDALEQLKELYKNGKVTKAELAAALRAHQAAVDSTKSSQREAAAHIDCPPSRGRLQKCQELPGAVPTKQARRVRRVNSSSEPCSKVTSLRTTAKFVAYLRITKAKKMRNIPAFQGKRKFDEWEKSFHGTLDNAETHWDGVGVGPSRYLASRHRSIEASEMSKENPSDLEDAI